MADANAPSSDDEIVALVAYLERTSRDMRTGRNPGESHDTYILQHIIHYADREPEGVGCSYIVFDWESELPQAPEIKQQRRRAAFLHLAEYVYEKTKKS